MPREAGGGSPDSTAIRVARANIRQHMKYTNWLAGTRPWLAGNRVTYADLAAAARAFAEQPPYGMRGVRYAYIEVGAAAQTVQLQAVAEGLGSVLVGGFRDEATAQALSLPAPVTPVALMCLGWPD